MKPTAVLQNQKVILLCEKRLGEILSEWREYVHVYSRLLRTMFRDYYFFRRITAFIIPREFDNLDNNLLLIYCRVVLSILYTHQHMCFYLAMFYCHLL